MSRNKFFLQKIKEFQTIFKNSNFDIVVGGGFAIDGFLKKITREHEDLDFDIVGDISWEKGFEQTKKILKSNFGDVRVKKDRFEVWFGDKRVDLEYVQRVKETKKANLYRFGSGKFSFKVLFYLYHKGQINNLIFSIENPHYIFAIKYLMPIARKKKIRDRDKKDIDNLIVRLSKEDLIEVLRSQLDYIEKNF